MSDTAEQRAFEAFQSAALSADNPPYPDKVSFVPEDMDGIDAILWNNIRHERVSTVVVASDGSEIMIIPSPRVVPFRWIDHLHGRERVQLMWRNHAGARSYGATTRLTTHPMTDLQQGRPLATA